MVIPVGVWPRGGLQEPKTSFGAIRGPVSSFQIKGEERCQEEEGSVSFYSFMSAGLNVPTLARTLPFERLWK